MRHQSIFRLVYKQNSCKFFNNKSHTPKKFMWDNIVEFINISEDYKSISLLYKPSKAVSKEKVIIQNGDFHLDGNTSYLLKNETIPKITLSQVLCFLTQNPSLNAQPIQFQVILLSFLAVQNVCNFER